MFSVVEVSVGPPNPLQHFYGQRQTLHSVTRREAQPFIAPILPKVAIHRVVHVQLGHWTHGPNQNVRLNNCWKLLSVRWQLGFFVALQQVLEENRNISTQRIVHGSPVFAGFGTSGGDGAFINCLWHPFVAGVVRVGKVGNYLDVLQVIHSWFMATIWGFVGTVMWGRMFGGCSSDGLVRNIEEAVEVQICERYLLAHCNFLLHYSVN